MVLPFVALAATFVQRSGTILAILDTGSPKEHFLAGYWDIYSAIGVKGNLNLLKDYKNFKFSKLATASIKQYF